MAVALVAALAILVGAWTSGDAGRWIVLALIPASGLIGAAVALVTLWPFRARAERRSRSDREAASAAIGLILNGYVVVGMIPTLWVILLVTAGP